MNNYSRILWIKRVKLFIRNYNKTKAKKIETMDKWDENNDKKIALISSAMIITIWEFKLSHYQRWSCGISDRHIKDQCWVSTMVNRKSVQVDRWRITSRYRCSLWESFQPIRTLQNVIGSTERIHNFKATTCVIQSVVKFIEVCVRNLCEY